MLNADRASWKKMLEQEMESRGETLADLVANTLTEEEMLEEFDSGYGGTEGKPFTAWSGKSVYFPVQYDGAEWVGSVSRHPDSEPTNHIGGG